MSACEDGANDDSPLANDAPPAERQMSTLSDGYPPVSVAVGTSDLITQDFVRTVASMVNKSYGYRRVSEAEVAQRLAMGDSGERSNRVLHIATRNGKLVGCCSSTKQTPWCPGGCGHWGLLVVDVDAQGTGVASALVAAAEERLLAAGLTQVPATSSRGPRVGIILTSATCSHGYRCRSNTSTAPEIRSRSASIRGMNKSVVSMADRPRVVGTRSSGDAGRSSARESQAHRCHDSVVHRRSTSSPLQAHRALSAPRQQLRALRAA